MLSCTVKFNVFSGRFAMNFEHYKNYMLQIDDINQFSDLKSKKFNEKFHLPYLFICRFKLDQRNVYIF